MPRPEQQLHKGSRSRHERAAGAAARAELPGVSRPAQGRQGAHSPVVPDLGTGTACATVRLPPTRVPATLVTLASMASEALQIVSDLR